MFVSNMVRFTNYNNLNEFALDCELHVDLIVYVAEAQALLCLWEVGEKNLWTGEKHLSPGLPGHLAMYIF